MEKKIKAVENPQPYSAEELKAMVERDKEARKQRAIARIQQVLEEERCTMTPIVILTAGNVVSRIDVSPVD